MKRRIRSKQFVITDTVGFWGRPGATLLLVLISVALMSVSITRPALVEGARTGVADLMTPLLSALSRPVQGAAFAIRDVSGLAHMQSEIAALRQENQRLRGWYQTAMHLQAENQSLKNLLHVKVDTPHEFITARVVVDAGNAYAKSLLVSAGAKDGVEKGQAVLSGDGLVGRVIQVGQNSSRILLITDMNSRVPVMIEGSHINAMMAGTNMSTPVLEHLPPSYKLQDKAFVMTSGHGGVFPAGLPVGHIAAPEKGMSKAEKHKIQLYANFDALRFVRIVNSNIDPNLRSGKLTD